MAAIRLAQRWCYDAGEKTSGAKRTRRFRRRRCHAHWVLELALMFMLAALLPRRKDK